MRICSDSFLKQVLINSSDSQKDELFKFKDDKDGLTLLEGTLLSGDAGIERTRLCLSHGAQLPKQLQAAPVLAKIIQQDHPTLETTKCVLGGDTKDFDVKDEIRQKEKELANEQDSNGWTPLMWAVHRAKWEEVKFLLRKGANPNAKNNSGGDVLGIPISHGKEMPLPIKNLLILYMYEDVNKTLWKLSPQDRRYFFGELEETAKHFASVEDFNCFINIGYEWKLTKKEKERGVMWYIKAEPFELDMPVTIKNVGNAYATGDGIKMDWKEALHRKKNLHMTTLVFISDHPGIKDDKINTPERQDEARKQIVINYLTKKEISNEDAKIFDLKAYEFYRKIIHKNPSEHFYTLRMDLKACRIENFDELYTKSLQEFKDDPDLNLSEEQVLNLMVGFVKFCNPVDQKAKVLAALKLLAAQKNKTAETILQKFGDFSGDKALSLEVEFSLFDALIAKKDFKAALEQSGGLDKQTKEVKDIKVEDRLLGCLEKIADANAKEQPLETLKAKKILVEKFLDTTIDPKVYFYGPDKYRFICSQAWKYGSKYKDALVEREAEAKELISREITHLFKFIEVINVKNPADLENTHVIESAAKLLQIDQYKNSEQTIRLVLGFLLSKDQETLIKYIRFFENLAVRGNGIAAAVLFQIYHREMYKGKDRAVCCDFWRENAGLMGYPFAAGMQSFMHYGNKNLFNAMDWVSVAAVDNDALFKTQCVQDLDEIIKREVNGDVVAYRGNLVTAKVQPRDLALTLITQMKLHAKNDKPADAKAAYDKLQSHDKITSDWKTFAKIVAVLEKCLPMDNYHLADIMKDLAFIIEKNDSDLIVRAELYRAKIFISEYDPPQVAAALNSYMLAYASNENSSFLRRQILLGMETLLQKAKDPKEKEAISAKLGNLYLDEARACINQAMKNSYFDKSDQLYAAAGREDLRNIVKRERAGNLGNPQITLKEVKEVKQVSGFQSVNAKNLETLLEEMSREFKQSPINLKVIENNFKSFYKIAVENKQPKELMQGLNLHLTNMTLFVEKQEQRKTIGTYSKSLLTLMDEKPGIINKDQCQEFTALLLKSDCKEVAHLFGQSVKLMTAKEYGKNKKAAHPIYVELAAYDHPEALEWLVENYRQHEFFLNPGENVVQPRLIFAAKAIVAKALKPSKEQKENIALNFIKKISGDDKKKSVKEKYQKIAETILKVVDLVVRDLQTGKMFVLENSDMDTLLLYGVKLLIFNLSASKTMLTQSNATLAREKPQASHLKTDDAKKIKDQKIQNDLTIKEIERELEQTNNLLTFVKDSLKDKAGVKADAADKLLVAVNSLEATPPAVKNLKESKSVLNGTQQEHLYPTINAVYQRYMPTAPVVPLASQQSEPTPEQPYVLPIPLTAPSHTVSSEVFVTRPSAPSLSSQPGEVVVQSQDSQDQSIAVGVTIGLGHTAYVPTAPVATAANIYPDLSVPASPIVDQALVINSNVQPITEKTTQSAEGSVPSQSTLNSASEGEQESSVIASQPLLLPVAQKLDEATVSVAKTASTESQQPGLVVTTQAAAASQVQELKADAKALIQNSIFAKKQESENSESDKDNTVEQSDSNPGAPKPPAKKIDKVAAKEKPKSSSRKIVLSS